MPKQTENSKVPKDRVESGGLKQDRFTPYRYAVKSLYCHAQRCALASDSFEAHACKAQKCFKIRNGAKRLVDCNQQSSFIVLCNATTAPQKAATSRRAACVCKSPDSRDEVVTHHHLQLLSPHARLNKDRNSSRSVVRFGKLLPNKRRIL